MTILRIFMRQNHGPRRAFEAYLVEEPEAAELLAAGALERRVEIPEPQREPVTDADRARVAALFFEPPDDAKAGASSADDTALDAPPVIDSLPGGDA